jgi:dephospho-CoA kinase
MIILGLTGSIGMGKSTTAKLFAEEGVPVHDADAAVHELYEGEAVPLVERAFPGTIRDGKVDRALLAKAVVGHPDAMKRLEAIVHPLVAQSRDRFLDEARNKAASVVVLDIPLLFETGGEKLVDAIVVVSAAPEIQRQRVMERPGMTTEKFEVLLAKQMPDAQKRERADYIVDSGHGIEPARLQVREILAKVATMPTKR